MRDSLISFVGIGQTKTNVDVTTGATVVYQYFVVNGGPNDVITVSVNGGPAVDYVAGCSFTGAIDTITVTKTVSLKTDGTYLTNSSAPGSYTGCVSQNPGVTLYGYTIKKDIFTLFS